MSAWLCRILGHRAAPRIRPAFCVAFHCERCRRLVPGGLAFWGVAR